MIHFIWGGIQSIFDAGEGSRSLLTLLPARNHHIASIIREEKEAKAVTAKSVKSCTIKAWPMEARDALAIVAFCIISSFFSIPRLVIAVVDY